MSTATMNRPFDFDALVEPIEKAETPKEARSAVWQVLREVKRAYWHSGDQLPARDMLAVVDAAAWQRGVSDSFRSFTVNQTAPSVDVEFYEVIPSYLGQLVLD
jgi:hypothetical protein